MQYGGARQNFEIGNLSSKYLNDSSLYSYYDSNLGYYIVIDLELYPGVSIDTGRNIALSCSNTYNKMWGALSDIVGQPYQSSELIVPDDITFNNKNTQKQHNTTVKNYQRPRDVGSVGGGRGLKRKNKVSHRLKTALDNHHNITNKKRLHNLLNKWHKTTLKR